MHGGTLSTKIKVIIADDTLIARVGWKSLLETFDDIEVVAEVSQAETLPQKVLELSPDVVITDLKWHGDDSAGYTAIIEMKKVKPSVKILAVTAYENSLIGAKNSGADMLLMKTFTRDEFINAIRQLAKSKKTD